MCNNFYNRTRRIDNLIRRRATGNPGEFARRLGMSISGIHYALRKLKEDLGAPIAYDKKLVCYYYQEEGLIEMGFRTLSEIEQRKINGGFRKFLISENRYLGGLV